MDVMGPAREVYSTYQLYLKGCMLPTYTPDTSELPTYASSVYLESNFKCKQEYTSPLRANPSRRWLSCHATLNNTVLYLEFKGLSSTKVLSMQHARIGFAGDYSKGHFPIRLRANGMQFLFDMESMFEGIRWMQALSLAIGIALPLEMREMPAEKYQTTRSQRSGRKLSVSTGCGKEQIDSDSESVCSASSTGSNMSVLICEEDLPKDVYFDMKDFGIMLKKETWEGRRWLIKDQWSLVDNNCIYSY